MTHSEWLLRLGAPYLLAVGVIALSWSLYRAARDPRNSRIWVVIGAIIVGLGEYSTQLPDVKDWLNGALGPGGARVFLLLTLFTGSFLVLCFFLIATGASRFRIQLNVGLWLIAAGVIVTLWSRDAFSRSAGAKLDGIPVLAGLDMALYQNYVLWASLLVAWRYSKMSRPPLSTGLTLVAGALLVRVLSGFVGGDVPKLLALFDASLPGWLRTVTGWGGVVGRIGFLIAVVYPGVVSRALMARRAWLQLRSYRELEPLWAALSTSFPATTLRPPSRNGLGDWLAWRSIRRRYYRRVIECRDGLVQISPHLANAAILDTPEQQAAQIRAALTANARDSEPTGGGVLLAAPSKPGFDADAEELVKLSRAFAALSSKG